ncbi:MAG: hypothetical protein KatS3mg031_0350 [Chitinophagales bacterium]|nr:MAG: hypothetical protein KatS3mg031_0350 [Chitinophagales bacterium]
MNGKKSRFFLKPGQTGIIRSLHESHLSARLIEMGFLPGRKLRLIRTAPGGCPLYFELHGQYIALRSDEADSILLDPQS